MAQMVVPSPTTPGEGVEGSIPYFQGTRTGVPLTAVYPGDIYGLFSIGLIFRDFP